MKYLLIAALLVSMGTYAGDGAQVESNSGHKDWPSLNKLWNETDSGESLKRALVDGTPSAEILLGYEYSDLDDPGGLDDAHAVLTRTRLNYQTGAFKGFDAFVQAQYVGPINSHFSPKDPTYDTVADPENFRFHQAYLAYTGYDSHARFGSQEINLDNARFIGNVGWRLNAQSFNAASIANHSVSNLVLYYAYADSINQIDGNMNHARQYHLVNAEYKVCEHSKASGFAYLQRNDNSAANSKLDTYGLRTWGTNGKITHDAMLALQRNAYYGSLFGEVDVDAVDVGAGVEYISGGDNLNEQFQTLNGTAHKFNGWADQFLATGGGLPGGLIDLYAQVSGTPSEKVKLMGVFHYFTTADTTATGFDGPYGYELDASAAYAVCKNFDLLAKVAFYEKDGSALGNFTNDETVFWLRGTLRF